MGYRLYIGQISKEEHEKMQKMSYPYLCAKYGDDGEDSVGVYDLVKQLFGFGKYYDVDTDRYNHFFAKKELQEYFSDNDFWVVDKEFLLAIIEKERKAMEEWYKECTNKTFDELKHHAQTMVNEWGGNFGTPYNLDLSKPHLVDSWKREYAIFDLVRIYKSFDWENNLLVYYGW